MCNISFRNSFVKFIKNQLKKHLNKIGKAIKRENIWKLREKNYPRLFSKLSESSC